MTILIIKSEETTTNYNSKKEDKIIFEIEIPSDRKSILELIKVIAEKINELSAITITT